MQIRDNLKQGLRGLFVVFIFTTLLFASVTLDIPEISSRDLVQGSLIGSGSYGDVYCGMWKAQPVAIKKLRLATLDQHLIQEFKTETELMWRCQFPNILRLHGVCTEPGQCAMVFDLMSRNSLYKLVRSQERISERIRWKIAIDIAQGLADLHRNNIIHRDLKSHNILLDDYYRAKISDFGLAKLKIATSTTSTHSTRHSVGTVRWRAPELFNLRPQLTSAADMYSYGMVLWEIVARKSPFEEQPDDQVVISAVKAGEREEIPADCPPLWLSIIEDCWKKNPAERPTAASIVDLLRKYQPPAPRPVWLPEEELEPSTPLPSDGFILTDAAREDWQKVLTYYHHHSVLGYDVARVLVIHNPAMGSAFASAVALLQQRKGNPRYAVTWSQEHDASWRQAVHKKAEDLARPYQEEDYPDVQLMPLWHGTQQDKLRSILSAGYSPFCETDDGYFGKGIYAAHEAAYSQMYANGCSPIHNPSGVLILNWAAMYSSFPVISSDYDPATKKLTRAINPATYDAHFIPVIRNPNSGYGDYIPTSFQQAHEYTEVMVRDRAQMLPRYLVYLQPSLPPVMAEGVMANSQVLAMFKALKDKLEKMEEMIRQKLKSDLRAQHQAGLGEIGVREQQEKKIAEASTQRRLLSVQQSTVVKPRPSIPTRDEAVYRLFLNGFLIYKKGQPDEVRLRIADLPNPLEGTFDLSRCGDTGNYLSINTGYRKTKKQYPQANPGYGTDRVEIWLTPRSLIERDLTTTAAHYAPIMSGWDATIAPIAILWSWSAYELPSFAYLTNQTSSAIDSNTLHMNLLYSDECDDHRPENLDGFLSSSSSFSLHLFHVTFLN